MNIKIKRIHPDALLPIYSHDGDSGMDISSLKNYYVPPKECKLVSTGLEFEIPYGFELQIRPRSGLALNRGITILNSPGTIDAGYRGELKILVFNTSGRTYKIKKGERIAQGVVSKIEIVSIIESDKLSETKRGDRGLGSTGTT